MTFLRLLAKLVTQCVQDYLVSMKELLLAPHSPSCKDPTNKVYAGVQTAFGRVENYSVHCSYQNKIEIVANMARQISKANKPGRNDQLLSSTVLMTEELVKIDLKDKYTCVSMRSVKCAHKLNRTDQKTDQFLSAQEEKRSNNICH